MPLAPETSDPKNVFNTKIDLSEHRRELMLRAMDGQTNLVGAMHCLHHYKFCDNILTWLICHHFTGQNLVDLIVKQFRSSMPDLVNFVVRQINHREVTHVRTDPV